MDLYPYISSVRAGVDSASALADEPTRQVAERLGIAIESSTRLALIHALSDAAGTISAELAPSSVELRMVGQDPEFVVTVHRSNDEPMLLLPDDEPAPAPPADEPESDFDEPVARVTLRLPQSVKSRVDERATASGISTNAWLMRVVMDALEDRGPGSGWWPPVPNVSSIKVPSGPGREAGAFFGPNGPFGENGVFGPHGPFGHGRTSRPVGPEGERHSRGNVQGWVR